MAKIKECKLVEGIWSYEKSFGREIKELQQKGYRPYGRIKIKFEQIDGISIIKYTQAMVLYEK